MTAVAEAPRPEAFPMWPGPVARPEPGRGSRPPAPWPGPNGGPRVGLAALRDHGWTVWFGQRTRQYWAAHTGRMRLVCADSPEELIRSVADATAAPNTSPFRGFHRNP
ncbi:hypothetical protein KGD83_18530 [Nocardiopsis akebiae]|uniref:Uncharacterized protein n=1 Tax=Nocardiopsis akebiae TaxID=2831968 RepID=A0ABX8C1I7_9ACTN|nr:hypothetical protein [Nocardiopsis akebiae]QUX27307.1 hypothetical protein KGD83_18530 [Nocardiopsis akebiae]